MLLRTHSSHLYKLKASGQLLHYLVLKPAWFHTLPPPVPVKNTSPLSQILRSLKVKKKKKKTKNLKKEKNSSSRWPGGCNSWYSGEGLGPAPTSYIQCSALSPDTHSRLLPFSQNSSQPGHLHIRNPDCMYPASGWEQKTLLSRTLVWGREGGWGQKIR